MPRAFIDGDRVHLTGVRNFEYRSRDDFTVRYEERELSLSHLSGIDFFVATSFSKSFSLYGERVGALSVVCQTADDTARVLSQLKIVIRTNYSNPPSHGAKVVAMVLGTPALRAMWEEERAGMRVRIKEMRVALQDKLKAAGVKRDMSFITQQNGMFSYSGLSKDQMVKLRTLR